MLEAITRRYYRIRALEDVQTSRRGDRPYVTGNFVLRGDRLELISTSARHSTLTADLAALAALAARSAHPANVVIDIYLAWVDAPADADQVSDALREALTPHPALTGRPKSHRDRVQRRGCSGAGVHLPAHATEDWPRSWSSATCTR